MKKLFSEYKTLFKDKKYKKSLMLGIFLLLLAGIISALAISYADRAYGNSLGDLILDNIPKFNFFWFRTYGTALITISILFLAIIKPRYIPALSKSIGLMYIIRACFIAMTHLKFHPEKIAIPSQYLFSQSIFQGNDLFFSGHVAFPFLVALFFWNDKKIRYCLISATIISGLVSLFAKTHYSIDIFATPFITYSIFKISEVIFKKDFDFIKINQKIKFKNDVPHT
jgi:hypothetical protein